MAGKIDKRGMREAHRRLVDNKAQVHYYPHICHIISIMLA